jgi:hypothetical protein
MEKTKKYGDMVSCLMAYKFKLLIYLKPIVLSGSEPVLKLKTAASGAIFKS